MLNLIDRSKQVLLNRQVFSAILAVGALNASLSAGLISEDFTGGTFDTVNFEIGDGTGSAATEAWRSTGDRGIFRTVASNITPTVTSPLSVTADVAFSGLDIAFLGVRSSGLRTAPYNEPGDSIYLRLHNFQGGHTSVGLGGGNYFRQDPVSGDSFWNQPVRVNLVDDGSSLDVTLTNLVTSEVNSFTTSSAFSFGGYVVFSNAGASSWDNIEISHDAIGATAVPEPAEIAGLSLVGLIGVIALKRRRKCKE